MVVAYCDQTASSPFREVQSHVFTLHFTDDPFVIKAKAPNLKPLSPRKRLKKNLHTEIRVNFAAKKDFLMLPCVFFSVLDRACTDTCHQLSPKRVCKDCVDSHLQVSQESQGIPYKAGAVVVS